MSHELSKPKQYTFLYIALTLASMIFGLQPSQLRAQEPADFVWSPATTVTEGADKCFFRKRFTLINPEQAELLVATTGAYRTYLNGRLVHSANSSEKFQSIAISDFVFPGINLIAVEVDSQAAANGLALKIRVKERGEARWRAMTADETWLTHNSKFDGWERNSFRELSWLPAARADLAHVSKEQNVTDKNDSVVPVVTRESMLGKNESKSPTTNTTSKPQTPVDTSKSASGLFGGRTKGETKLKSAQADLKSDTPPTSIETASAANEKSENGEKTGGWFQLSKSKSVKETGVTKQVSDFTMQDREVPVVTSAQAKQELAHADPGPEPVESVTTVFEVNSEFNVDPIMSGEETGSVIAMTFDEFGRMIFSQEGGHVMIADLSINYGEPRVATLCDQVENCQGLLCVNGQLYVTGNGPDGLGLYCLERIDNRSTTMTVKRTLLTFTGEVGEHGPHGLTLGPDGRIYCVVGNASSVKNKTISSPYRFPYETDLAPRYEDPAGHASGIKSPGGTVVRVDLEGTSVQIMAGGIRNAYDLVFNTDGDLFVHDSDMESDLGLPWYRPTALTHVVAGSDLGWRSGWSKYPYYYSDVTPPLAQTGRGSPTGAVCYEHLQFPTRYHGALFLADWSEGRILAVTAERKGASYVAQTETFLAGKPLNVTDIEVGEDGALYFSTGGRGTSGGIYRVAWKGSVPDSIVEFEDDLTRLTRNPQPNSAWARQNMALIMSQPSVDWKKELQLAAKETSNSDAIRTRALTNLFLFGLLNDESFARTMAADSSELVRGKIAELCATLPKMAGVSIDLLKDASPYVQRKAVEGLLISNVKMPVELGVRLCGNENEPALMQLGCRILEQHSPDSWRSLVLNSSNKRECLVGSIALLKAEPSKENAYAVLAKNSELMADYLNDRDFMDLIRVSEMALSLAKIEQNKIGGFTERIAQEFPTKDPLLNRELIKVITYLKPASLPQSVVDYLRDSTDDEETKTLVAMHMATLGKDSTDELRLAVIESLSQTIEKNPGGGFQHYLARCIRESAEGLSVASVKTVIANGERWPYALVPVFYKLLPSDMVELAKDLCELDKDLLPMQSRNVVAQARLGIIALLAEGKTEIGSAYLRECWQAESSRRNEIVIGLANNPTNENWTYLVASLPILDDMTVVEVLTKLNDVRLRPVAPQHYRDVLEIGYRVGKSGAPLATKLLKHWTNEQLQPKSNDWQSQLDAWSEWFSSRWPEERPVSKQAPPSTDGSTTLFNSLLNGLESNRLRGNAERGLAVFTAAECSKCHRFGTNGDSSGPDLTSLASRFSKRETLESIIYPSKVVSDQYQSTVIVSDQGVTYSGLKVRNGDGSVSLIQPDASRIRIAESDIVESKVSSQSPMPSGLLERLNEQEVADLMAFLYREHDNNRQAATDSAIK